MNDFYEDLSVESYVIIPNHIHIMLWVKGAGNGPSRPPVTDGQSRTPVPTGTNFITPYPPFFIFSPVIASFEVRDYRVVFVLQTKERKRHKTVPLSKFSFSVMPNPSPERQTDFEQKSLADEREAYKGTPSEETRIE